jgi:hypothetical protein
LFKNSSLAAAGRGGWKAQIGATKKNENKLKILYKN